ncbi:PAS domain-containing protein, partial [Desulfobacula sp.]|nr:PAS domain-containing protein [Desulfobacula sp.]
CNLSIALSNCKLFCSIEATTTLTHRDSAKEIIENPDLVFDHIPKPDADEVNQAITKSASKLMPYRIDHRFIKKNGDVIWIYASSHPRRLKNGDIIWDGIGLDITERKKLEEALKKNEVSLLEAQRIGRTGNWTWNIVNDEVCASKEIYNIFGFNNDHILTYDDFIKSVHPEDRDWVEKSVEEALRGHKPYNIDHRMVLPNGEIIIVNEIGEITFDESGNPIRMEGIVQNITERKKTENKLQESEEKSRLWLKYAPVCTKILDLDFNLQYMSESGIKELKIDDINEHYGKPYPFYFYPDSFKKLMRENLKKAKETGKIITQEASVIDIQGNELWYHSTIVPVKDENGRLDYIMVVSLDTTKRKLAEMVLKESEERFKSYMNYLPGVAYIKDYLGRYVYLNKKFETNFNTKLELWQGKTDKELNHFPGEIVDQLIINDRQVLKTKKPIETIEKVPFDNEMHYWLTIKFPIIGINEKEMLIAGVAIDITDRKRIEEELRESKERFDIAMNASQDGLFDWNLETNEIYYSPGWKRLLGYQDNELPNDFSIWETLTEPDDVKRSWEMQQELINKKRDRFEIEFKMKHKDGHWVNILSRAKATFDNDGKATRIVGTHVDITDRKRTEAELLQQKQFLQKAQEIGKIGTWELDIKKNELLWTDENYKIFGIPIGTKLTYESFLECVHPDDREYVDREWKAAFTGKPYDIAHRLIVDGKTKWVREKAELFFNQQGECIRGTGFTQDITEQKKSEIEKIKEKQKAERYLNMAGVMFIGLEKDGTINVANKKACQILECQQEEILGLNWFDNFIPQSIRHEVHSVYNQLIDGNIKPVEYYENLIITNSGKKKHIAWHNSVLRNDDGGIIGILSSGEDVTEKMQLTARLQQAQKMESIGTLAGGIAHDFNNILFPVIGHAEMILMDIPDDSPFKESLNQIHTSALRAKNLVKQILTFSRQESSELMLMKMQPIIKETLKLIRSTIPTTIEINQDITPDCGVIKADPTQIHQIVMNLATNAYHAMEETGGELKVSLKRMELGTIDLIDPNMEPGSYACLTVADTGVGMDKKLTDKMFDPFFTTKEIGKGTGMGLSVVHGIVTAMGGAIQVYSEPGKGTQFYVYFPIEKNSSEEQNTPATEPIQGGTERILLVDDEEAILTMEKLMLERLGYPVTSRTSSLEALEAFRTNPDKFDLIITDMQMPNMSGDKLSAELTKIRPDIPILLCTGFSETMSEEKAASLGIKGFILKPIVMKDLFQKIREVLDECKI